MGHHAEQSVFRRKAQRNFAQSGKEAAQETACRHTEDAGLVSREYHSSMPRCTLLDLPVLSICVALSLFFRFALYLIEGMVTHYGLWGRLCRWNWHLTGHDTNTLPIHCCGFSNAWDFERLLLF